MAAESVPIDGVRLYKIAHSDDRSPAKLLGSQTVVNSKNQIAPIQII